MASNDFTDDLRQSFVITRNEIKKFFSGKKILIFTALMVLIMVLIAVMPYLIGGSYKSSAHATMMFAAFISFIIMLGGVLFTATSLVSEFEERTALILFTRPVRKSTIFLGKLVASILVMTAYVAVYYVFTAVYCLVLFGSVEGNLLTSFVLCICGIIGISGLSMLMSSLFKKGSTASILTLVVLLLVLSIISGILGMQHIETSWILSNALNSISTSIGTIDGDHIVASTVDVGYNALVMIGWGVVTSILAYIFFKRRDF